MLLLHSMFFLFVLQAGVPAVAQSGRKAEDVVHALKTEITSYLTRSVQPVMLNWKHQFDASLKQADLSRLEALRKQSRDLLERMTTYSANFVKSRDERDYRRAMDYRSKLEFAFENNRRILGEAQRVSLRSKPALALLQSRIDSSAEEWKAGAIRIFIEWFARNQAVIGPALSQEGNDKLINFMAAAKDLRLEQIDDHAIAHFLLWDGTDFVPAIMAAMRPETPLTFAGPERERILLFEECSPPTFSTSTVVRFSLPVPGKARVQVVDAQGRITAVLLDEQLPDGKHSCQFKSERLPSGSYFLLLTCRDLFDVQVAQISR